MSYEEIIIIIVRWFNEHNTGYNKKQDGHPKLLTKRLTEKSNMLLDDPSDLDSFQ